MDFPIFVVTMALSYIYCGSHSLVDQKDQYNTQELLITVCLNKGCNPFPNLCKKKVVMTAI